MTGCTVTEKTIELCDVAALKHSYCYHPRVNYYPITAFHNEFYSSYTMRQEYP